MKKLLVSVVEHRIADHYLPKLQAALYRVDTGMLWDQSAPNATGAIVLHMIAHLHGVTRLLMNAGSTTAPIEELFPMTGQTPAELVAELTAAGRRFRAAIVATRLPQSELSDALVQRLLHLMEHLGYHTGQVVYAVRLQTGRAFRFAQNGLGEAALRRLVEEDLRR